MPARTRNATSPAPATPAKKTTAKKTTRPRKTAVAKKTTTPRLSLVKATPPAPTEARRTVVDLRYPLTPRRRLFVGPMGPQEQAAIRAALDTARLRLPIPVRTWNGSTAQLADGTLLIHNPGPDRVFTAHIACPHGAVHGWPIASFRDLGEARTLTRVCVSRHTANTPGPEGTEHDWNKAIQHGIRPTNRLGEGVKTVRKTTADTQPLSLDEIGAHIAEQLAERAADTETPKEHPQP